MKYFIFSISLLLALSCSSVEEEITDPFEFFWREMDRKYVYFDEKGVDWNAVYATYKPRTVGANEEELLPLFQEIINLLKDGHVAVETPEDLIAYHYIDTSEYLYTNISRYEPEQEQQVDNIYTLTQLKDHIVYLSFYDFRPYFDVSRFWYMMGGYSFSKGIIIDIRHNGGGSMKSLCELASCFFTGQRTVLYQRNKTGHGHHDFSDFSPIQVSGRGLISEEIPVVVLTGSYTYSAANFFAAVMKSFPNVTLIGMPTGGGGSARFPFIMPNGWTMHYPIRPTYDTQYRSIESGVAPHYVVATTREEVETAERTGVYKLMEFTYQYLMNQ